MHKLMLSYKKLVKVFNLDWKTFLLYLEAFIIAILAKVALTLIPFKKLSKLMGDLMTETTYQPTLPRQQLVQLGSVINSICINLPWEAACYVQALTAKWMLNRRKINSTLYLGATKHKSGKTKGHAWLRSGEVIVTGKKGHKHYVVIATYA